MTNTSEKNSDPMTYKHSAIQAKLDAYEQRYRHHSNYYLLSYRSLLVSSALLSAGAAVVINLNMIPDQTYRKDSASILAALATVSTTLLGTMGLESNWRSNRQARDRVRALQLELLHEQPQYDRIINDRRREQGTGNRQQFPVPAFGGQKPRPLGRLCWAGLESPSNTYSVPYSLFPVPR
jgi:hypothetical protein